jgi:polyferredoxin
MASAILAYMAIIGFLGWAAWNSGVTEKAMFVVNVVLLWMSAIWFFGYPALIGPAVLAAVCYLALLVVMTSSDLRVPVTVPARPRPANPHDES